MGLFFQLPRNVIQIPGSFPNFPNILFLIPFFGKLGNIPKELGIYGVNGYWSQQPGTYPQWASWFGKRTKEFSKIPWDISHFPNQCQRMPAGFPRFDWETSLNIYFSKVTLVIRKHYYLQFYWFSDPIHPGCTRTLLKKINSRQKCVNFRIKFPGWSDPSDPLLKCKALGRVNKNLPKISLKVGTEPTRLDGR